MAVNIYEKDLYALRWVVGCGFFSSYLYIQVLGVSVHLGFAMIPKRRTCFNIKIHFIYGLRTAAAASPREDQIYANDNIRSVQP